MSAALASTAAPPAAPGAGEIALEVAGVSKTFQVGGHPLQALQDVSFRVRHGVVTGLVGPDAVGKTTLMRLAAGLLAADAGHISVLGFDAATQSLAVMASSAAWRCSLIMCSRTRAIFAS